MNRAKLKRSFEFAPIAFGALAVLLCTPPGMHERAESMGGRLKIWSEPGAGTEAELTVPVRIAYEKFSTNNGRWARLGRRLGLTAPSKEA